MSGVPAVVAGRYTADSCRVGLSGLLALAHARWVAGRCTALDVEGRLVRAAPADGGAPIELPFDLLSLNTAATTDREALEQRLPGARDMALARYPTEAFLGLWPRVVSLSASFRTRAGRNMKLGSSGGSVVFCIT